MCGGAVWRISDDVDVLRNISGQPVALIGRKRQQSVLGLAESDIIAAAVLDRGIGHQREERAHRQGGLVCGGVEDGAGVQAIGGLDVRVDGGAQRATNQGHALKPRRFVVLPAKL